jgi:hypothetical protein
MEAIQRVVAPALQVEIPTAAVAASSPDLSMGEESLQAYLDMASSLDPKAANLLPEMVATGGRCTSCGRSYPLHRGCLTILRSL